MADIKGKISIGIGPQGPRGLQGPQGRPGIQGEQGPQGERGEKGEQGIPGPVGPKGQDGSVAWSDLSEVQKASLKKELKGEKGDVGPAGPQGKQGIQGLVGPKGDTGLTGPQGPEGRPSTVPGPKGEAGPQGPIGKTGATGPQGPAGIDGKDGSKIIECNNGLSYDWWKNASKSPSTAIRKSNFINQADLDNVKPNDFIIFTATPASNKIPVSVFTKVISKDHQDITFKGIGFSNANDATGPAGPAGVDGKDGKEMKFTKYNASLSLQDWTTASTGSKEFTTAYFVGENFETNDKVCISGTIKESGNKVLLFGEVSKKGVPRTTIQGKGIANLNDATGPAGPAGVDGKDGKDIHFFKTKNSFNYASWLDYGTRSSVVSWSSPGDIVTSIAKTKVGDVVVLTGNVSDKPGMKMIIYGIVKTKNNPEHMLVLPTGIANLNDATGGGGSVDLQNYYTKGESDAKFLKAIGSPISASIDDLVEMTKLGNGTFKVSGANAGTFPADKRYVIMDMVIENPNTVIVQTMTYSNTGDTYRRLLTASNKKWKKVATTDDLHGAKICKYTNPISFSTIKEVSEKPNRSLSSGVLEGYSELKDNDNIIINFTASDRNDMVCMVFAKVIRKSPLTIKGLGMSTSVDTKALENKVAALEKTIRQLTAVIAVSGVTLHEVGTLEETEHKTFEETLEEYLPEDPIEMIKDKYGVK